MGEQPRITLRGLGLIGLLGSVGGAINAWLCYANFPVPVGSGEKNGNFSWHIIPAGAVHGALLAISTVALAAFLMRRNRFLRWTGIPIVGWFSGWLSLHPSPALHQ